jgi:hypothetical protein
VNFVCQSVSVSFYTLVTVAGYCEFDDISIKETTPDWDSGNSALLTKSTASPHGGFQALRIEYNGITQPNTRQTILTIGTSYRVTGWARGDGGSAYPTVRHGGTLIWTGTTSTAWQYFDEVFRTGATQFRLYNNVASSWVEFDDVSVKETCPAWTPGNSPLLTKSTVGPHGGVQSLKVEYDGTSYPYALQTILTVSKSYRITGWAQGDGSVAPRVYQAGTSIWNGSVSASWQYIDEVFTATVTNVNFRCWTTGAGYAKFDDVSIKEIDDTFYDAWFDGEKLVTARLEDGIGVFGFNDSRIRFPVYYTPLGYGQYGGEISIQGVSIPLVGDSPSSDSPYVIADSDSLILESDMRWDKITYQFYGSFDRLQDVKDANPQIPTEIKARLYVPRGSIIKKPIDGETESSTIGAVEWRRQ